MTVRLTSGLLATIAVALTVHEARAHAEDRASDDRSSLAVAYTKGIAHAPFYTDTFPSVESDHFQLNILQAHGRMYLRHQQLGLEARVAFARVGVEQPAGSYDVPENIAGNLVLRAAKPVWNAERGSAKLAVHVGGGAALPLQPIHSDHGNPRTQRAFALAHAGLNWREPETFTPGVIGVVPDVRLESTWPRAMLFAACKLPLLVRYSDVDLPSPQTRPLAFFPVLESGGALVALDWLRLGVAAALGWGLPAPVASARASNPAQLSVAPELAFKSSDDGFEASLSMHIPASGPTRGTLTGELAIALRWPQQKR